MGGVIGGAHILRGDVGEAHAAGPRQAEPGDSDGDSDGGSDGDSDGDSDVKLSDGTVRPQLVGRPRPRVRGGGVGVGGGGVCGRRVGGGLCGGVEEVGGVRMIED